LPCHASAFILFASYARVDPDVMRYEVVTRTRFS
jgi:hypothetical protein